MVEGAGEAGSGICESVLPRRFSCNEWGPLRLESWFCHFITCQVMILLPGGPGSDGGRVFLLCALISRWGHLAAAPPLMPRALPRARVQWKGQRKHRVTLEVCIPLQYTQMSLITYILFSNWQMGYGMLIHYHPVKNDAMKETW